jgi:branched-chain amino acid transport system substrate-binding protein
MGPECEGIVSAAHFAEGADLPATQAFVKAYQARYDNKIPSLYGFTHYIGAMWIAKAINAINGKIEDRNLFLDTVMKTDLPESPLGKPVRLDAYGNPVYDVFIRRVSRNKDGKLVNAPIDSYPQVSQFWKYDPETFMKQPPYSRDFQGIKKA